MTTMENDQFFRLNFAALTGRNAFPWQAKAFSLLSTSSIPTQFTLPTGTGKTSLIAIWLIALAWQAEHGRVQIPRRLVWIVNRRVVVDQATDEATTIIGRLNNPSEAATAEETRILSNIRDHLADISLLGRNGHPPVAVSTLRGQLADSGDWKVDPSRPAIVIGTVDMVGSRLLFSGYGDGKYKRPLHAGLLGQDSWVVLDEAHLTPAFAELLQAIHTEQARFPRIGPWHFSRLSATQRAADHDDFKLDADDEANDDLGRRLKASKSLFLHELDEKDDELERMAELALKHKDALQRVIVFVKSPESAYKVAARIAKDHVTEAVRVLTGTQRGYERDTLAMDPVFAGFRSNPKREPPNRTHYLVATAAGEVGADLDADHLICDLGSLDSLIQRFGRVNRLGLCTARVDLVVPAKPAKDVEQARYQATLDYLRGLPEDTDGGRSLSPADLDDPPLDAFSSIPPILPLARHWLDMWSLTSIGRAAWPDRPEVAPWLHGVISDLPETWVVWRAEIDWLGKSRLISDDDCTRALDACPVLPQEQLREPSYRVRDKLRKLAQQRDAAQQPAILLGPDGAVAWRGSKLRDLVATLEAGQVRLEFSTILLPTAAGGLTEHGQFDPRSSAATDKAETRQSRRRFLLQEEGEQWQAFPLIRIDDKPAYTAPSRADLISVVAKTEHLKPVLALALKIPDEESPDDDSRTRYLLYLNALGNLADSSAKSFIAANARPEPLSSHLRAVGWTARQLIERIANPGSPLGSLREVLGQAGEGHDTGKARSCWQSAIGNNELDRPLAKSGHNRFNPRLNGHYRHEFGSLLDASAIQLKMDEHRDLMLQCIAAHHGHGRPHFNENGYDRGSPLHVCREAAAQTLQRFGRLQARYGWWGLAYLEGILKAADTLVSAGLSSGPQDEDQP